MKIFICCLLIASVFATASQAQNVGIGTTEPINKLQVQGSLLITTPTAKTNAGPTGAQTRTMINASTVNFAFSDSAGRIYDPGGPAGNYNANLLAYADIDGPSSNSIGTEITLENINLGIGDSLIIKESPFATSNFLAVGNFYNTAGKWIFNSSNLYIIFKSNADVSIGSGFSLLFRRLYDNSDVLPDVSGFAGGALFFDVKKYAIRSGFFPSISPIGNGSAAFGNTTTASGSSSFATGYFTTASGTLSTAIGYNTVASANYSIAMGESTEASGSSSTATGSHTEASGDYSTAMGYFTTASGNQSTSMGYNTTASGNKSTAMGNYVNTNNHDGAFLIGDNSTTTVMNGTTPNNFRARFDGGYRFYTSSDYSTSCALSPGANAWSTTSDMRLKENFETVNGEDFLKKIAVMRLVSWNYKKQDPSKFRHYGPMAQEFYAAFGKDKYGNIGNDTTINQADFDGVNLIAIQALEKRTGQLKKEADQNTNDLRKELEAVKTIIDNQQKQIDQLKALINKLVQGMVLK